MRINRKSITYKVFFEKKEKLEKKVMGLSNNIMHLVIYQLKASVTKRDT